MTREFEWTGAGLASVEEEITRLREENEMLKGGTRGASSRWKEIERLRQHIESIAIAFDRFAGTKRPLQHRFDQLRNAIDAAMEADE